MTFGLWAQRLRSVARAGGSLKERLDEVEAFRALEGEARVLTFSYARSRSA